MKSLTSQFKNEKKELEKTNKKESKKDDSLKVKDANQIIKEDDRRTKMYQKTDTPVSSKFKKGNGEVYSSGKSKFDNANKGSKERKNVIDRKKELLKNIKEEKEKKIKEGELDVEEITLEVPSCNVLVDMVNQEKINGNDEDEEEKTTWNRSFDSLKGGKTELLYSGMDRITSNGQIRTFGKFVVPKDMEAYLIYFNMLGNKKDDFSKLSLKFLVFKDTYFVVSHGHIIPHCIEQYFSKSGELKFTSVHYICKKDNDIIKVSRTVTKEAYMYENGDYEKFIICIDDDKQVAVGHGNKYSGSIDYWDNQDNFESSKEDITYLLTQVRSDEKFDIFNARKFGAYDIKFIKQEDEKIIKYTYEKEEVGELENQSDIVTDYDYVTVDVCSKTFKFKNYLINSTF